ncbi:MAG TPA: transcriptional regulator GcvA [Azospirillum sp.]|nr:transcriptional regulator GcvA [Azospirillum sp.]
MAYRLPPLTTLRLFEAAGRHLSFKRAAEELNLTPSAVSHGIQTLEEWLGVALFVRGNRTLALTPAGSAYLPRVQSALEALAGATDAVPGRRSGGHLSISVAPTFALRWLIPRLPAFNERHPGISVSLDTAHRQLDFPRDGVDLGIRLGRGPWPALAAVKLLEEVLVPVCAPDLAARIRTVEDLRGVPLLHVASVSEDWPAWLEATGNTGVVDVAQGLRFDALHLATDAAMQGLGVAVGRRPTVDPQIAAGTLVPVLGPPVPAHAAWWLVGARESAHRPDVAAFRAWLRAEMAAAVR